MCVEWINGVAVNGDIRNDKYVGTLEKQYNRDFGVRKDMHVGALLKETGKESINDLIQSNTGKK